MMVAQNMKSDSVNLLKGYNSPTLTFNLNKHLSKERTNIRSFVYPVSNLKQSIIKMFLLGKCYRYKKDEKSMSTFSNRYTDILYPAQQRLDIWYPDKCLTGY